jgi:hypothetical protein
MCFLGVRRDVEGSDAEQITVGERTKHRRAGEPVSKPCQRLADLGLAGAAEGFRAAKQGFQTKLAI